MIRSFFLPIITLLLLCAAPAMFTVQNGHAMPPTINPDGQLVKGTVMETMNAGGYTYMLIKTAKEDIWVAIPGTDIVKKGQDVVCQPGMTMVNFKSPTLNRTFSTILFSAGLVEYNNKEEVSAPPVDMQKTGKAPEAPGGSEDNDITSFAAALQQERTRTHINRKMSDMEAEVSGGSLAAIVPAKDISVEKAAGENSYTIEGCFSNRKELNNRTVRVRGKVVKVSKMIMGRNWVHLQDGSGNPMENTHNLVFTTQEAPEMNSIVTMEGTLHADRDFGAGYKYTAIVENAVIL